MSDHKTKSRRLAAGALAAGCLAVGLFYPQWIYAVREFGYYYHRAPTYTGTIVGPLGVQLSQPFDINERGDIVGVYANPPFAYEDTRAFVSVGGMTRNLGTLGGNASFATAINARGEIAGFSQTHAGDVHAFRYSNGVMLDLNRSLGDPPHSEAFGINEAGDVVGTLTRADGTGRAFMYARGKADDLGTLGGGSAGASDIADSGIVVGSSETGAGSSHAYVYNRGRMIDIGTLPGGLWSIASRVSSSAQVTGWTGYIDQHGSYYSHAFRYSGGVMEDLGTLPRSSSTAGLGINNRGQVVGYADVDGWDHGFLYTDGVMYDLNDLMVGGLDGWTVYSAYAINSRGQIAAMACKVVCAAFRLDPR
jgi:probable HAF family extracellular repeat protein